MLTGELSGLDSMISAMYLHQRCITSCCGKLSKFFGSSAFNTPNKLLVPASRKIEYSLMPACFNNCSRSGHKSSCRLLYSSSLPGNNFILKATLCMQLLVLMQVIFVLSCIATIKLLLCHSLVHSYRYGAFVSCFEFKVSSYFSLQHFHYRCEP